MDRRGYQREFKKTHREWFREYDRKLRRTRKWMNANLVRKYGITLEQYEELFEEQGGVCAICGKVRKHKGRDMIFPLEVDHDHKTGKVRGLLCGVCNRNIGFLGDSVESFEKILGYLKLGFKDGRGVSKRN